MGPIYGAAIKANNRERGGSVTTNQLAQLCRSEWVGKQQRIEKTVCDGESRRGGGLAHKTGWGW